VCLIIGFLLSLRRSYKDDSRKYKEVEHVLQQKLDIEKSKYSEEPPIDPFGPLHVALIGLILTIVISALIWSVSLLPDLERGLSKLLNADPISPVSIFGVMLFLGIPMCMFVLGVRTGLLMMIPAGILLLAFGVSYWYVFPLMMIPMFFILYRVMRSSIA